MDIDLKADAEKWGQDWLDRLNAAYSGHSDSNARPFEVFIRQRLIELLNMKKFTDAELVQWIETAHGVVARTVFGYQTIIRDSERLLEIDPAKLVEAPRGRPN
ncbi:hypothetical protein ABIB83_007513 [Bradyrhizobium sp. I1.8.5]|uniref:hypothetical protein n=1 Tax=Bradyrhizobium sp. I1.8.5 TaxID=3156365 RepID=UPI0033908F2F